MLILGSDIIANQYTINPVFGNNSWAVIKAVCQAGSIPASWAVGDTKTITGKDNNTYHIRLSDKQANRYDYSNSGLKTHAVFEFVELPNIQTPYNKTATNVGGLADSQVRKNLNGLTGFQTGKNFMTAIIPDDLAGLLEEVNIVTTTGGSSWDSSKVSISANKLFPLCVVNITGYTTPQHVAEGTQWDYYAAHTSTADRIKALVTDSTIYKDCLTASPGLNSASTAYLLQSSGNIYYYNASSNYHVSPCFAF